MVRGIGIKHGPQGVARRVEGLRGVSKRQKAYFDPFDLLDLDIVMFRTMFTNGVQNIRYSSTLFIVFSVPGHQRFAVTPV